VATNGEYQPPSIEDQNKTLQNASNAIRQSSCFFYSIHPTNCNVGFATISCNWNGQE